MNSVVLRLVLIIGVTFGVASHSAFAKYPDSNRRITLIIPFSAGGSNDILARVVAQKMNEDWKLPVVVVNVVGGSGAIGTERVARSQPDGYTILMVSSSYTINSAVMKSLPYDPDNSFAGVTLLGKAPMVLAISKSVPASNAAELLSYVRSHPGKLNYGAVGVGSVNTMAMELLKKLGKLDIKGAPYREGNQAVNDLLGNHLDMFVGSFPQMMSLTQSHTATAIAIAVTGPSRSNAAPDLPTLAEAGIQGYELEQWWGIVVPAKVPKAIVVTLNEELNAVMKSAEVKGFMEREGARATPSTPDAFDKYLHGELTRWRDLVRDAH